MITVFFIRIATMIAVLKKMPCFLVFTRIATMITVLTKMSYFLIGLSLYYVIDLIRYPLSSRDHDRIIHGAEAAHGKTHMQ